jgi:hypothetical protein
MTIACTIDGEPDILGVSDQASPATFLAPITSRTSGQASRNRQSNRRQHGSNSLHEQDETTAKEQRPQRPFCGHHGGVAPTRSGGKKVAMVRSRLTDRLVGCNLFLKFALY